MPDKKNLVAFPKSARKRKELLQQAENLKMRRLTRARSFVGWMLIFSIVLFSAVHFTLFTPASIRQMFRIVRSGLAWGEGVDGILPYPEESTAAVAPLDNSLVMLDDESLRILQMGGMEQFQTQLNYGNPVLISNDDYVLAYDRGAYDFSFYSPLKQLFSMRLTSPILNASLGNGDSFIVVTDETGYRSAVTVYAASSTEEDHHLWRWKTPDYYVQDAVLSPSGTHICALTFRQEGAKFESALQFFDIYADEVRATVSLDTDVGYTVRWLDDSNVAVITDKAAYTVNRRGEKTASMRYSSADLLGFAFDESSFLLAERSWSGDARATITRYDKNGNAKHTLHLSTIPESISYGGNHLGILTSTGLYVYDSGLRPDWKCETAGAAQQVMMTSDGSAWLLYSKYAQRVTPGSLAVEDFS